MTLLLFALASAALVAVPGPNLLYIMTRSMADGRRVGIASALGVETGTLVWIAAAATGLAALLASSAIAFNVVKWAGVVYLVYLGVRTLLQPADGTLAEPSPVGASVRRAYLQGLVINLLNPKVAIFFLAFLPQFIDPGRDATSQILTLGAIFFVMALVIDLAYAVAAGALGGWLRRRPRFLRRQRYLTGGTYFVLGVVAALAGDGRRR